MSQENEGDRDVNVPDQWPSQWPPPTADRIVVVAPLRKGARDQVSELIEAGPPFEPGALGFERHAVFLSSEEVVFLFEGPSAARRLADMIDDMVTSASFSAWAHFLRGTPRIAHEQYFWELSEQDAHADS